MTRLLAGLTIVSAAIALAGADAPAQQPAPKAEGHWEGTVQYGQPPLSIAVDLSKNSAGAWIGSFSVPGSTTLDVPIANIVVDDLGVRFTLALPDNPSFEGTLSPEGATIAGMASNNQGSAPFEMARKGDAHVNVPPPSTAISDEFLGKWEGTLSVGGVSRRIGLKLVRSAEGTAAGTLTAIDQGGQEFQVTTITVAGKTVQLNVRSLTGTYGGTLTQSGTIVGEWSQGGQKFPLTFKLVNAE